MTGERGDQREEAGLREMEIGEELIYYAEGLAGVEENRGFGFSGVSGMALPPRCADFSAASSRARTTVVPMARIGRFSFCACAIACAVASGIS